MPHALVKWAGGKTFIGTDSTRHSVVMSAERAELCVGMKPSDMLMVALGTCTAVDVVEILAKKRTPVSALEIEVGGEQDADPPWTFRKFHLTFKLRGQGLSSRNVAQAIQLAEEKYCSVAATVRGIAEITFDYQIEEDKETI